MLCEWELCYARFKNPYWISSPLPTHTQLCTEQKVFKRGVTTPCFFIFRKCRFLYRSLRKNTLFHLKQATFGYFRVQSILSPF
jgi:hypothetical protein